MWFRGVPRPYYVDDNSSGLRRNGDGSSPYEYIPSSNGLGCYDNVALVCKLFRSSIYLSIASPLFRLMNLLLNFP